MRSAVRPWSGRARRSARPISALGHARYTFPATTWLGEIGGGNSPRVNEFAALLTSAGLAGTAVEDIEAIEWWKLCYLLPGAMVTALARTDYGTMFFHPLLAERFLRLTQELVSVARAGGIAVTDPPGRRCRPLRWPIVRSTRAWRGYGSAQSGIARPGCGWCLPWRRTCWQSDARRWMCWPARHCAAPTSRGLPCRCWTRVSGCCAGWRTVSRRAGDTPHPRILLWDGTGLTPWPPLQHLERGCGFPPARE